MPGVTAGKKKIKSNFSSIHYSFPTLYYKLLYIVIPYQFGPIGKFQLFHVNLVVTINNLKDLDVLKFFCFQNS